MQKSGLSFSPLQSLLQANFLPHPERSRGIRRRYLKAGIPGSLDCARDDEENLLGEATEAEKMTIRSSALPDVERLTLWIT